MKSFKTHIKEGINTSHQDMAMDKNTNPIAFQNPEVLRK